MGKQLTTSKITNIRWESKEDVLALSKNPKQWKECSMEKKLQLPIGMKDTKFNLKQNIKTRP
jgi:hypothetical protein